MRLVLASASPARLGVLRAAGVDPVVRVSGVDEDAIAASMRDAEPAELVTALAEAKADAVSASIAAELPDCVLVSCDSMLATGSGSRREVVGKPGTAEVATRRWRSMAGGTGELVTGHAVRLLRGGRTTGRAAAAQSTLIRFAAPSEQELAAYVGTGEPLAVAGAFTLDGRGGWFVDGIDGDPSSVIGISLPLTRRLLGEVGVSVVDLWSGNGAQPPVCTL